MVVTVAADELIPLRTVMRDLQIGVARYYASTGSGGELGSTVRTFIANCQVLNDWMRNAIGDSATYRALFEPPRHAGADVIDAVTYVRNVSQHVLHVVGPSKEQTLVGGVFGFRNYAFWDSVPQEVHDKLWPPTKARKQFYEAELEGKELVSTMLAVLRFYAGIAPAIVDRDRHGEWTGFPLMSQPGIGDPLHPEEPLGSIAEKRAWLDARKPSGDARVICGQVTVADVPYIFGFTFVGRLSFTHFFETVEQVNLDIAAGFLYLEGNVATNATEVTEEHPGALQGMVVESGDELEDWTSPKGQVSPQEDWCSPGVESIFDARGVELESADFFFDAMSYEVRRARRLNAIVPPTQI